MCLVQYVYICALFFVYFVYCYVCLISVLSNHTKQTKPLFKKSQVGKGRKQQERFFQKTGKPQKRQPTNQTRKGAKSMKNYKITVDGYTIGVVELTAQEAQELEKDQDITLERI